MGIFVSFIELHVVKLSLVIVYILPLQKEPRSILLPIPIEDRRRSLHLACSSAL